MTLDLTYIIGGVAATGVVLYFAWPAFKQMINIKAGNAVNGSTKASEKLRAEQITLTADVKKQLTAVATIKGAAEAADREVTAAQALIAKLTGDFKMAPVFPCARKSWLVGAENNPTAPPRPPKCIWAACSPSTAAIQRGARSVTMNRRPMSPASSRSTPGARCARASASAVNSAIAPLA